MIQIVRFRQAIHFAVKKKWKISKDLFVSYIGDTGNICCIIRAAAMAGNADANSTLGLVIGAAKFLQVSEAEIWAFIDGFESKTRIDFDDPIRNWFGIPSIFNAE